MKLKRILSILFVVMMSLATVACSGTAVSPTPTATTAPTPTQAAGSDAGAAEIQTFVVAPGASQASYIVNEEFFAEALEKLGIAAGKKVVVGTTPGVTGEIQLNFNQENPLHAAEFTVDMSGLSTDQSSRDEWLEDNAIQTSRFPQAIFTATSATGLPQNYVEGEEVNFQLSGDLTVRDVTNNVTFDVTAVLSGDTLTGTATLDLSMTDFGITPPDFINTLTVADPFTIEVELTARRS